MDKARRKFFLEWIGFSCGLVVVFISGAGMIGKANAPRLVGLIAGSFGAGAAMASSIRDYADARAEKKKPGGASCVKSEP